MVVPPGLSDVAKLIFVDFFQPTDIDRFQRKTRMAPQKGAVTSPVRKTVGTASTTWFSLPYVFLYLFGYWRYPTDALTTEWPWVRD